MSLVDDIDLDENANSSDKFIQDVLPQIVDLAKRFEQQSKEMATKMSVSLDEEATNLIRWQTAFTASSKVVTTVDEMLQTVLTV